MTTKAQIKADIISKMKEISDNVEEHFFFPEEYAELQKDFPYITIIFDTLEFEDNSKRGKQKISIIGIANGDTENLVERVDRLEKDMFNALYRQPFQPVITEISNSNLFRPFGLDAGLFLPYGGVRLELIVPNVIV